MVVGAVGAHKAEYGRGIDYHQVVVSSGVGGPAAMMDCHRVALRRLIVDGVAGGRIGIEVVGP